jgi:hypothetical protein
MKHAQFVRTLGLISVLSVAAAVVGCGSESQQPAAENIKQASREFFKAKTSQNKANAGSKGRSTKRE